MLLRALEQRDGIQRTVTLNAQYRMHPVLGGYVHREFYEVHEDGAIESPRPAEQFRHDLPGYADGASPVGHLIDVPRQLGRELRGQSKSRPVEARVIAEVKRLMSTTRSSPSG